LDSYVPGEGGEGGGEGGKCRRESVRAASMRQARGGGPHARGWRGDGTTPMGNPPGARGKGNAAGEAHGEETKAWEGCGVQPQQ